ncbi:MAG: hypothetical protein ACR2QE_15580 [Acidimicrobiales bacterium]
MAVLAAGCGSDDDDDAAGTSDSNGSTSVATTAAPPETTAAPATTVAPTTVAESNTIEVLATDYAFSGIPETIAAGTELTLFNESTEEVHEVLAFKVAEGEERSLAELVALPPEEVEAVTELRGVLVAYPGEAGFAPEGPVVLEEPGRYAFLCLIPTGADPVVYRETVDANIEAGIPGPPDVEGGPPHVVEGMFAQAIVE